MIWGDQGISLNNHVASIEKDEKEILIEEKAYVLSMQALESYVETLHPLTIIKRILYRPYIGRWFPYIDVQSPGYWSQLSFLYGKVNILISNVRRCSRCFKVLDGEGEYIKGIPISLCKACSDLIYYDYYGCLTRIMERALAYNSEKEVQTDLGGENSVSMVACKDLLHPDCGLPSDPERINPCLKNHGIGFIIFSPSKIGVLIGKVDSLKYQMIWMGGIYGVILGYSNKIMNIEILEKVLNSLVQLLKEEFSDKTTHLDEDSVEILSAMDYMNNNLKVYINPHLVFFWLFLRFYNYYTDYYSKKINNTILMRCMGVIRVITKQVINKLDTPLEILDIIEIYKIGNPLHARLRFYIENTIYNSFNGESMKELSWMILNKAKNSWNTIESLIKRISEVIGVIEVDKLKTDLEIHEVLGSLGPYLIINSNVSIKPSLIQINDLIGKEIRKNTVDFEINEN